MPGFNQIVSVELHVSPDPNMLPKPLSLLPVKSRLEISEMLEVRKNSVVADLVHGKPWSFEQATLVSDVAFEGRIGKFVDENGRAVVGRVEFQLNITP